jgi:type I restriction enzyme S subunit
MGSAGQNGFHDTALAKGPGVVLGRSGASFGQAHYCEKDFWPHNTALYVTDFRGNDPLFVFYFLKSIDFTRHNSGGAQQSLNRNFIYPIPVAVPRPPEQRAIVGALSDVDALIDVLDQLIAKKRDLKQGAMQQLLTGQNRLPGVTGEWEVKRLGELADIISGGTPKTSEPTYWSGSIKWCTPTDITGCSGKYLFETERTISTDGLASCSAQLLPVGSLLLCSRATIGEVRIAGCEICTNQGFKSLVCKPDVSNEFLYYKLLTMKSQMVERAIGSTFLEISKKDTAALELSVPEHGEQTAIAEVLSDMDAELAALEQRRDKTRALKQGMMQELLTGRTRLV